MFLCSKISCNPNYRDNEDNYIGAYSNLKNQKNQRIHNYQNKQQYVQQPINQQQYVQQPTQNQQQNQVQNQQSIQPKPQYIQPIQQQQQLQQETNQEELVNSRNKNFSNKIDNNLMVILNLLITMKMFLVVVIAHLINSAISYQYLINCVFLISIVGLLLSMYIIYCHNKVNFSVMFSLILIACIIYYFGKNKINVPQTRFIFHLIFTSLLNSYVFINLAIGLKLNQTTTLIITIILFIIMMFCCYKLDVISVNNNSQQLGSSSQNY